MTYQTATAVLGVIIAITIFYLVRRDRLHARHALAWLPVAGFVLVLGVFPELSDAIAPYFGVGYPPTLVLVGAVVFILVKLLLIDIEHTRTESHVDRLVQEIAILRAQIADVERRDG